MSKFKVGEVAVLIKARRVPVGLDVEVVSESYMYNGSLRYDIIIPSYPSTSPESKDGEWRAPEEWLRKKPPKEELGSWEEIEKFSNWNPTRVPAELT